MEARQKSDGLGTIHKIVQSPRPGSASTVNVVQASEPRPTYKPALLSKVKDLADHESRTDPVFYCGKPGIPRIGPPRKIVQLPKETIFLYEDVYGDTYIVRQAEGRTHAQFPLPA